MKFSFFQKKIVLKNEYEEYIYYLMKPKLFWKK